MLVILCKTNLLESEFKHQRQLRILEDLFHSILEEFKKQFVKTFYHPISWFLVVGVKGVPVTFSLQGFDDN